MNYFEKVHNCKTEDELFAVWKTKEPFCTSYIENDKEVPLTIDHSKVFISDGVVNHDIWDDRSCGKHILYVLKEAYGGDEDWSLAASVRTQAPWSAIWNRIVEWTYGISNTTPEKAARYEPDKISLDKPNKWLNQIAVVNLKKSGGKSNSKYPEISAYADYDAVELVKQIEMIDPEIIVCGATFEDLNRISGNTCEKGSCDNWYYYSDAIGGKERLFIDYYHPANRYPSLLNYYGIVNIYQQAIIEKCDKEAVI